MPLSVSESFQKIENFVVLMLENRSFDHLLGYLKKANPQVAGLIGTESNYEDPNSSSLVPVSVRRATNPVMRFDPAHEFEDVQMQLYGPQSSTPSIANPAVEPAPMSGFVSNALTATAKTQGATREDAASVMECFQPDQLPVLSALAGEFALFNTWHSSLPGPTWPNRFFVHAATSGGLTDSPVDPLRILEGFSFQNGTIYERLRAAGKHWRIYHEDLPQAAGIRSLRDEFINPVTMYFRWMKAFEHDINIGYLPEYTFIEPNYDIGDQCRNGNSMHPLNDIRKGEQLVKRVYEALRNSDYWAKTMLIITFDEHGGFYDHVSPPLTVPTGDDTRYASRSFAFDHLGVRVPAIVVSAFTQKGTIIGTDAEPDPETVFDHSSVLATVEKRFGMQPLTKRDAAANTLDVALNLTAPRLSSQDAPTSLPMATGLILKSLLNRIGPKPPAAASDAPLSQNEKSFLALALACHVAISESSQETLLDNHGMIKTKKEAADYIQDVKDQIDAKRQQTV